jgi:hypothetical protein
VASIGVDKHAVGRGDCEQGTGASGTIREHAMIRRSRKGLVGGTRGCLAWSRVLKIQWVEGAWRTK